MKDFETTNFGVEIVSKIKLKKSVLSPKGPEYSDLQVNANENDIIKKSKQIAIPNNIQRKKVDKIANQVFSLVNKETKAKSSCLSSFWRLI